MALGVAFLRGIEGAYRPGMLDRWYYAATQHDTATAWSAWCFTLGVLLLVPWAAGLARALGPYSWPGAALAAVAAMLSAVGTLLPFVVVTMVPHGEAAIGETLLGVALTFDSLFNLVFGVAMVLLCFAMARDPQLPMWLPAYGLVASVLTMAVVSQAWSPVGADLVLLAGPAWLGWVAVTSWQLQRLSSEPSAARRRSSDKKRVPLAGVMDSSLAAVAK
ncbi:hypothetical protein LBMAG42_07960 [Deltaproteobacteria bacterium]|nr:hypothetical protein LBMAG42_07960 [Deltaproteobacteria bacterium]